VYEAFIAELEKNTNQEPVGRSPKDWYYKVINKQATNLPTNPFNRETLREFCKNKENNNLSCYIAVMAWGGQRLSHSKMTVFQSFKNIDPIITELRKGELNRYQAFERFRNLRVNNKLKGTGAAFYTKLIYFCDSRDKLKGYIFDQWLAKSIELLLNKKAMKLSRYGYVTDEATADDYEYFCKIIDYISNKTDRNPDEVETALFSYGGKKKGDWRQYVIKEHQKLLS